MDITLNEYINQAKVSIELAPFSRTLRDIDTEKFKTMYCKDSIGFLAIKENLDGGEFVFYVKELMKRLPQLSLKLFYFDEQQKDRAKVAFEAFLERVDFIKPVDIYDVAQRIEVYLWDLRHPLDFAIVQAILRNSSKIAMAHNFLGGLVVNLEGLSLADFDEILLGRGEPILKDPQSVGFCSEEIAKCGSSYHKLVYNSLLSREIGSVYEIDTKVNALDFLLYKHVELLLEYSGFKESFLNMHRMRNGFI